MKTLGQRIEEVRIERGLRKTDIWKPAKLSSGIYSQWLNGMGLDGENLIKVASILNVSPDWLQTGKGNKEPNQPVRQVSENIAHYGNSLEIPLLNAYGSMGSGNDLNEIKIQEVEPDFHGNSNLEVTNYGRMPFKSLTLGIVTTSENNTCPLNMREYNRFIECSRDGELIEQNTTKQLSCNDAIGGESYCLVTIHFK